MERNANYALVGLSTLILTVALVVFVVWLARLRMTVQTCSIASRRPVSCRRSASGLALRPLGEELLDEARQITSGSHAEFGEDLVQVPFHRPD